VIQFLAAFQYICGDHYFWPAVLRGLDIGGIREVVVLKTLGATRGADCDGVLD